MGEEEKQFFQKTLSRLTKDDLLTVVLSKSLPRTLPSVAALGDATYEKLKLMVDSHLGPQTPDNGMARKTIQALEDNIKTKNQLVIHLEERVEDLKEIVKLTKQNNISKNKQVNNTEVRSKAKNVNLSNASEAEVYVGNHKRLPGTSMVDNIEKPQEEKIIKKSKQIIGDSDPKELNCGFSAATKKAWLCIGKVNKGTKPDTIRTYLQQKYNRNFTVEALPTRDDAVSVSFKLGADFDLLAQLENCANWPKGVIVKRFTFFRQQTAHFQD